MYIKKSVLLITVYAITTTEINIYMHIHRHIPLSAHGWHEIGLSPLNVN